MEVRVGRRVGGLSAEVENRVYGGAGEGDVNRSVGGVGIDRERAASTVCGEADERDRGADDAAKVMIRRWQT